jgi:putative PIN family toxin of toxin-antitoxin system
VRIVLDTNVLVSGLLRHGSVPQQVLELAIAGQCEWLVDSRIEAEYQRVLRRPFLHPVSAQVGAVLAVVGRRAIRIVAAPLALTLPDESDRPFLEVAVAGGADAIVTGNAKHFRPGGGTISIPGIGPREFLELLAQTG